MFPCGFTYYAVFIQVQSNQQPAHPPRLPLVVLEPTFISDGTNTVCLIAQSQVVSVVPYCQTAWHINIMSTGTARNGNGRARPST